MNDRSALNLIILNNSIVVCNVKIIFSRRPREQAYHFVIFVRSYLFVGQTHSIVPISAVPQFKISLFACIVLVALTYIPGDATIKLIMMPN